MTVQYCPTGLTWHPLSGLEPAAALRVSNRLSEILARWEGTPYRSGIIQQGRRGGVYCTAFVARVLDELFGREPTPMPRIPHDVGLHNPRRARRAMRWFMRQFPGSFEVANFEAEPGDVLVVGPKHGGPGHAMFVGPRPNTVWQASGRNVHYTGLSLPDDSRLFHVRRFRSREVWAW